MGYLKKNGGLINMKDYFTNILLVIAYSGRTQAAIYMGLLGFVAIYAIGDHYLTNIQLSGHLAPFTEVIKEKLLNLYGIAAWGVLFRSLWLAVQFYRKDKKKAWF